MGQMGRMGPMIPVPDIHQVNEILMERAARQIPAGFPVAVLPPEVKLETAPRLVRSNRYQRRRALFGRTMRESR